MKNKEVHRVINIEEREIPLRIRWNPRARKIILRVDNKTNGGIITLPFWLKEREALLMIKEKSNWLLKKLDNIPPKIPFQNGNKIPILGIPHVIIHNPDQKGIMIKNNYQIWLGGHSVHLARRLNDWLRKEAKRIIQPKAVAAAAKLRTEIGRITIRDTKSRWGSCSPSGNLSFCWRLILAPEWVLNYVIAHEVSHLLHMNHGPEFWKVVANLDVRTDAARVWLNKNTEQLQRYG